MMILGESKCSCATALSMASERNFTRRYEDRIPGSSVSGGLVRRCSIAAAANSNQIIDETANRLR